MSSPLLPTVGVGDTGFGQSRLMQESPHIDGWRCIGAGGISVSGSAATVLTRNGNGNWTLDRTAAGAETYFFRITLADLLRIGEPFRYSGFGGPGIGFSNPPFPPKGIGVTGMVAILQVGVVALTSATLRLGKTVYSATVAPVQTNILAATALGSLAVSNPAAPLAQSVAIPLTDQAFFTDDLSIPEIELAVVMAATGTLALAGLGAHLSFNYN